MKYFTIWLGLASLFVLTSFVILSDSSISVMDVSLTTDSLYGGTIYSLPDGKRNGLIIGDRKKFHSRGAIEFKLPKSSGKTSAEKLSIGDKVSFKVKGDCATGLSKSDISKASFENVPWTIAFDHHGTGDGGHKTGVIVTLDDQTPYYLLKNDTDDYGKPVCRVGVKPQSGGSIETYWVPKMELGQRVYYSETDVYPVTAYIYINGSEIMSSEQLGMAYGISNCHFHHDDPPSVNDVRACINR